VLTIPTSSHFPRKSIWRVKAHSRVAFFVWTVALGNISVQPTPSVIQTLKNPSECADRLPVDQTS
jgi:hypothetical protein